MIILDYYGIPGSGKTTKSHEKANDCRKKGMTIVEPSYDLDHRHNVMARKLYKLLMTAHIFFSHHNTFSKIQKIVKENGYKSFYDQLRHIANIASKLFVIDKYRQTTDCLIFDEGLAQAAISLSVNSHISAEDNLKHILVLIDNAPEIHWVRVKVSIEIALQRIMKRDTRDTRIEAMKTQQEKEELMKLYEKAADQISNMMAISP